MGDFDAELYLRLAGERLIVVLDEQRDIANSALSEAARALAAVGAITPEIARLVIDDYGLARALRQTSLDRWLAWDRPRPAARTRKPSPRRVVPCDAVVETAWGILRVQGVVLAEDATRMVVTWRPARLPSGDRARPPVLRVTDDRGATTSAQFSGCGADTEWWCGQLVTATPLDLEARWIEVDGTRVELTGEECRFEVTIEAKPEEPLAHRYLWQRVAVHNLFYGHPARLELAIEALIAAGVLEPDDPVIAGVRQAERAITHTASGTPAAPGESTRALPGPWRSLLRPSDLANGPEGTVTVGAVTPVFDDVSVTVLSLDSGSAQFGIHVEVRPGLDQVGMFEAFAVPTRELAWWAADDLGNYYIGHIGSLGGDDEHSRGEILSSHPLDPKASRLDVMPTGEGARAVIKVPLPWFEQRRPEREIQP